MRSQPVPTVLWKRLCNQSFLTEQIPLLQCRSGARSHIYGILRKRALGPTDIVAQGFNPGATRPLRQFIPNPQKYIVHQNQHQISPAYQYILL